ncbi:MAG TPA: hydantoinase B/oxoprolinase family protein [Candidatus Binatia bacterium]|nr:hydantoinase B/oxoprolinase family protein [Candidatus Binatia bacterium]
MSIVEGPKLAAGAVSLDGITLEIVGQRIAEIVSTMEVLLFHSGYSTILRESNDGSATVLDRNGRVVVGAGSPVHIAAYYYTAQGILSRYPWERMNERDAFVINDPYIGGTHHVPDLAVVTPVFWEGRPLGFCATIAHKSDVGGIVPGSSAASSREIFHDGVLFPGLKYWTADGPVEDAVAVVTRNSRTPELVAGDIRAQIGAVRMGEVRVHELVRQYGYEAIVEAMERLQDISYDRIGDALEGWPDGEAEGEAFLDSDGVDLERRVRFHAKVRKAGRSIAVDFSGSDEQVAGPVNLRPQSSETASLIALLGYLDPSISLNGGTQRAVTFVNPPGRITNARFPAPCNNYMPSLHLLLTATQTALLALGSRRASAPDGFGVGAMTLGYRANQGGRRAVQYELIGPSLGASSTSDGAFQAHPVAHTTPSASIEILETEFPMRLRCCEAIVDSAGPGTFRGGLGCVREYELLEDAIFTLRVGGFRSGSWGVRGGEAGLKGRCIVDPGTERERALPALYTTELPSGTILRVETAGGSGFGDPKMRDREAVLRDVRNGYVSREEAARVYGLNIKEGNGGSDAQS